MLTLLHEETPEYCEFVLLGNPTRFRVSPKYKSLVLSDSWHASPNTDGTIYIKNSKRQYLHRIIAAAEGVDLTGDVDHRDGNALNCCTENLRAATKAENGYNRGPNRNNACGIKGVSYSKGRWQAQITVNGYRLHLGYFDTPEEAGDAYARAAEHYHGEFARTARECAAIANQILGSLS